MELASTHPSVVSSILCCFSVSSVTLELNCAYFSFTQMFGYGLITWPDWVQIWRTTQYMYSSRRDVLLRVCVCVWRLVRRDNRTSVWDFVWVVCVRACFSLYACMMIWLCSTGIFTYTREIRLCICNCVRACMLQWARSRGGKFCPCTRSRACVKGSKSTGKLQEPKDCRASKSHFRPRRSQGDIDWQLSPNGASSV